MYERLKARLKRLEAQAGAGREKPRLRFVTVEGKLTLLSGGLALSKDALKKSLAGYYRAADRDIERVMIMPRPGQAVPVEDETSKLKREIRELEEKRRELRARKARKKPEARTTGEAAGAPRLIRSLLKKKNKFQREVEIEKRKIKERGGPRRRLDGQKAAGDPGYHRIKKHGGRGEAGRLR